MEGTIGALSPPEWPAPTNLWQQISRSPRKLRLPRANRVAIVDPVGSGCDNPIRANFVRCESAQSATAGLMRHGRYWPEGALSRLVTRAAWIWWQISRIGRDRS